MKNHIFLLATTVSLILPSGVYAADNDSHGPRLAPPLAAPQAVPSAIMEPKNVPDFARDFNPSSSPTASAAPGASGTALQAGAQSSTLPAETRLKLVVECPVDARTSQPGDLFEAHAKDDLFLGRTLLLPRGSLIRGRISAVTRPRLISRAAKIGLHLEQITTPTGEVIPLDAALEFQKGFSNQHGELDPGTNFATRVGGDIKTVTGLNSTGSARGALLAANIATLGAPAVATLLGSSTVALFRSGDNVSLQPGQELEILLTNDLGLQIN